MKTTYHKPVMLEEAIQGLKIDPDGVYVDVTFGGGGHSYAILECLSAQGKLVALDQDQAVLQNAIADERFHFIQGNFSHLQRLLKFHGITQIEGVLADFGVSSHQFDVADRGFSTRMNGPLDMRMSLQNPRHAQQVVNQYSSEQLHRIFKDNGEVRMAGTLANLIVDRREKSPLETTQDLVELLRPRLPKPHFNKIIAQIFQAIRIEVNGELDAIKAFLEQATALLKKGGRLVCISYHSLEDRLVKRYISEGKFEGKASTDWYGNRQLPLKKVGKLVVPSEEEIKENSRARSGKLRIAEKL